MYYTYYYRILLLLTVCFCFSCTNTQIDNELKVSLKYNIPQIPQYARILFVETAGFGDVSAEKVMADRIRVAIQSLYPDIIIADDSREAEVKLTVVVKSSPMIIAKKSVTQISFLDNLAHKFHQQVKLQDIYHIECSLAMTIEDPQLQYIFDKKKQKFIFEADSRSQMLQKVQHGIYESILHWLTPQTIEKNVYFAAQSPGIREIKKALTTGNIETAIQHLNLYIAQREHLLQSRDLLSADDVEFLAGLYDNRAKLLKTLQRDSAADRDRRRAEAILTFIR